MAPRNRRSGHSKKTIKGEFGAAEIAIPHDRNGAFEPVLVKQHETRFDGFDGKILSLYARGMSVRAIYTTNAIESLNMRLRKVIKNHCSFPTDAAALKVIYLALYNVSKKWTMPTKEWKAALNRFAIAFEERFPL